MTTTQTDQQKLYLIMTVMFVALIAIISFMSNIVFNTLPDDITSDIGNGGAIVENLP